MKLSKMKFCRIQAGLTQDQAAEKLNISQSLLSMIENKRVNIDTELLLRMSKLYSCSYEDLK